MRNRNILPLQSLRHGYRRATSLYTREALVRCKLVLLNDHLSLKHNEKGAAYAAPFGVFT